MPNRPAEWPVIQAFEVVNQLAEDELMVTPCTKSSCWYNSGKDQECTRKLDNITPNSYDCLEYRDAFITPPKDQPYR